MLYFCFRHLSLLSHLLDLICLLDANVLSFLSFILIFSDFRWLFPFLVITSFYRLLSSYCFPSILAKNVKTMESPLWGLFLHWFSRLCHTISSTSSAKCQTNGKVRGLPPITECSHSSTALPVITPSASPASDSFPQHVSGHMTSALETKKPREIELMNVTDVILS